MKCEYCDRPITGSYNYCPACNYPCKWHNPISVDAPDSLVRIAMEWYDGQWSAMYSTVSTGSIWAENVDALANELRHVARSLDIDDEARPEDIEKHLLAIVYLASLLPEEA